MSIRSILVVVVALVCGLSAAIGVKVLLERAKPASTADASGLQSFETASVVVAAVDIPRGRVLTAEDLKVRKWPKEMLPAGILSRTTSAKGRSAMVPILAGEPILDKKLAGKGAGRGLASLIPKGMRAYTIQASKAPSSVAGFILPGNHVDVLLNLRGGHDDDTGGGSTTTLLQAVEILAVDQELDAPADNKVDPASLGTVTLLVTPEQAALLDLGQNMGQLSLALRNPEDVAESNARPAILADIRFRQEKPLAPEGAEEAAVATAPPMEEQEPEVFQIVTLRGSQRGQVKVMAGR